MQNKNKKNLFEITQTVYSFERIDIPHWISYWYQIKIILTLSPFLKKLLVVGKGDGIVANILKEYTSEVKTLDIDYKLKPDYVASVEKMPLADNNFDIVLCTEVLEHLPFEKFEKSLSELKRVAKKCVILSLPHFGPPIKFSFKIPLIREKKIALKIPISITHTISKKIAKEEIHYWEIGEKNYSLKNVKKIIKKYFKIKKEFLPFENLSHHFFILEK